MTTAESASRDGWRRRERRSIPPFGDGTSPNSLSLLLERVLSPCRFAPFPDRRLSNEPYTLEAEESNRPVEPRFVISTEDVDSLTNALGCNPDDLVLGLTVRSRHLRRYERIAEWVLSSLPEEAWSPSAQQMKPLQTGRDIDFILSLRVSSKRRELSRLGLDIGKVIVRKEFSIREPSDTITFPFEWVDFGGNTGYPDELLWTIKWHDVADDEDRFNRPINEVLTVWGNTNPV